MATRVADPRGLFGTLCGRLWIADGPDDVLRYLGKVPESERRAIGARARRRVLREHTAAHRARELEEYVTECRRQNAECRTGVSA